MDSYRLRPDLNLSVHWLADEQFADRTAKSVAIKKPIDANNCFMSMMRSGVMLSINALLRAFRSSHSSTKFRRFRPGSLDSLRLDIWGPHSADLRMSDHTASGMQGSVSRECPSMYTDYRGV